MKPRRAAALALMGIGLAGCAVRAQGQPYKRDNIPPTKAIVYLYNQINHISSSNLVFATTSGTRIAINCGSAAAFASTRPEDYSIQLDGDGYHEFALEAGDIVCSAFTVSTTIWLPSQKLPEILIKAKAGHDYYVDVWYQSPPAGILPLRVYHGYGYRMDLIDAEEAQTQIEQCKEQ